MTGTSDNAGSWSINSIPSLPGQQEIHHDQVRFLSLDQFGHFQRIAGHGGNVACRRKSVPNVSESLRVVVNDQHGRRPGTWPLGLAGGRGRIRRSRFCHRDCERDPHFLVRAATLCPCAAAMCFDKSLAYDQPQTGSLVANPFRV